MSSEEPPDPILRVTAILDELRIDYAITGSVAGSFYGLTRMTYDTDIVIDLSHESVRALVAAFRDDYYIDEDAVHDAVRREAMFNVIPFTGRDKVDFIILKGDPFERIKFDRRTRTEYAGVDVWAFTAEDVVLSKLEWARESYSDQQFRDVRAIMAGGDVTEHEYFDEWVRKLKLEDVLAAARASGHDN